MPLSSPEIPEIRPRLDANRLVVRPGFLDDASCSAVVEAFARMRERGLLFKNPAGDPYWDYRYIWLSAIPPEERATRELMHRVRVRVIRELEAAYGEPGRLYSDGLQLVRWPVGVAMPPHADNAQLDGTPNEVPWRDYASVLYLNDEFEDGELYFPRLGAKIRPRRGLLVGFPGGVSHEHGVHAPTGGERYTMPSWYTRDPAHRDPCELEWDAD